VKWRQFLLVGLLAMGCGPRDADVRLRRLQVERQALLVQLDHLEDRMVADQARVRFWREMRQRHESVTAIACNNLDSHAESMAMLARQRPERQAILPARSRVAARWTSTP
jgi:hypothetical protein